MFSFFSRDPASSFGYEIGEHVPGLDDWSIWKLHQGKRKSDGEGVSVFAFDIKGSSETQVEIAKAAFKRMKTLRHPNFLTYLDGLESEKVLYVVTEPVRPLSAYLTTLKADQTKGEPQASRDFEISWGIHQVIKGLSFLIKDCKMVHNNICLSSIYVNRAGEWLLGGTEYTYSQQSDPPIKIMPLLEKYDPPEKSTGRLSNKHEWSTDMWGLGCLIWEVYNGPLQRTADLKSLGKLPKALAGQYATLVSANPRSRPEPTALLVGCQRPGGFLHNKFIETMLFLSEIQIKDQKEKVKFLESLNVEIEKFPESFCKHKVLPELIKAFEYGDAGANVLTPLLKVGKLLEADEYQRQVVPCIIKMFSSTDRQTRVKLLQQMNLYIEHIPVNTINDQIYASVSLGFNDTNPLVRETTIKAMMHVASKLNYKNLNEDLMKHFARLQAKDDQGGIRTNTTVCLGKIATYLHPQVRQKVLISAYSRALRDPFPPSRQATLGAVSASLQFFHIQDVAMKLLPAVCPLTRDSEKTVRDAAFKCIESLLSRLKAVSDDPELMETYEKETSAQGSGTCNDSQSWTGWAVTAGVSSLSSLSSLTSKFNRSSSPAQSKPSQPSTSGPVTESRTSETVGLPEPKVEEDHDWDGKWDGEDNASGWDTEDKVEPSHIKSSDGWDDWGTDEHAAGEDDDEFAPIEPNSNATSMSSYNWDSHAKTNTQPDDFFGDITGGKPHAKQATTQKMKSEPPQTSNSGWNDDSAEADWLEAESDGWGNDDWGAPDHTPAKSKKPVDNSSKTAADREEKRLARQKALAEKRANKSASKPLKLGAKKLAVD